MKGWEKSLVKIQAEKAKQIHCLSVSWNVTPVKSLNMVEQSATIRIRKINVRCNAGQGVNTFPNAVKTLDRCRVK